MSCLVRELPLSGFSVPWWAKYSCKCLFIQNTHWALLRLTGKLSYLTTMNIISAGVGPPSISRAVYSAETIRPKESLHLFLISPQLLTLPPLQWACFQGDKHHVTQHCESCNNIVFIAGDGWNFSHFTSWTWENKQECFSSDWTQNVGQNVFFLSRYFLSLCSDLVVSASSLSLADWFVGCVWFAKFAWICKCLRFIFGVYFDTYRWVKSYSEADEKRGTTGIFEGRGRWW